MLKARGAWFSLYIFESKVNFFFIYRVTLELYKPTCFTPFRIILKRHRYTFEAKMNRIRNYLNFDSCVILNKHDDIGMRIEKPSTVRNRRLKFGNDQKLMTRSRNTTFAETGGGWGRSKRRLKVSRANNYAPLWFINIHANIAINSRQVSRDRYALYIASKAVCSR